MAGTYAVVAWLIVQIAATTFSGFGIPEWAFRFVALMVVLGFPVAVLLAWAFELTPDGVKLTKNVTEKEKAETSEAKHNVLLIGFAAGLPTVIFGALAFYFYFTGSSGESREFDEGRPYYIGSLAVLPIEVISGQEEMGLIADGLHEEILTQLSEMDPLDVVSRTSTLQYREHSKSVSQIAEDLGADFVLEGSVQRMGNKWRLTLQLIEASSDMHLDSKTYDRSLAGESDLADQKILAWKAAIGVYRKLYESSPPTGKPGKRYYEYMEQKKAELTELEDRFWGTDGGAGQRDLLRPLMEKASELISADPLFGEPYRRRLVFRGQGGDLGVGGPFVWFSDMKLYSEQALEMNPEHFDTQIHTGTFLLNGLGRPDLAIPYLQRGLKLYERDATFSHNWPYYHLSHAHFLTGSSAVSLKILERVPQEPELGQLNYWTDAFEFSRRFEEGIDFLDTQLARAKEAENAHAVLSISTKKAEYSAWWEGSSRAVEEYYKTIEDDPNVSEGLKGRLLFFQRRYAECLEMMSTMDSGNDPFAIDVMNLINLRGIALREAGHVELSKSYLEQSIESISNNASLFVVQPGIGYSMLAGLHAYLGDREASLEAIRNAELNLDAAINLPVYYLCQGLIARAYFELEDYEAMLQKLKLMLSGPSGSSLGRVLLDFNEPEIFSHPEFQKLAVKYAHHLKDPAILDTLFEETQD